MKHIFRATDCALRELRPSVFVFVMTILTILIILPFLPVFHALEVFAVPGGGPSLLEESPLYQLVVVVLLAPLFETLIFQTAPILISRKHSSLSPGTIILASSLFFAVAHSYSIAYIFYAFLIGLLLAYSYTMYLEKTVSAFWVVATIHSLRNMFSWVLSNV